MADKLRYGTKAWQRRQDIWRHNGFIGSAKMMQSQCRAILNSSTPTTEAKQIAVRIEQDAELLASALRSRNDTYANP